MRKRSWQRHCIHAAWAGSLRWRPQDGSNVMRHRLYAQHSLPGIPQAARKLNFKLFY